VAVGSRMLQAGRSASWWVRSTWVSFGHPQRLETRRIVRRGQSRRMLSQEVGRPLGNTKVEGVWRFEANRDASCDANDKELHSHHFTLMGGVHGNELMGINIIKRLAKDIESGKYKLSGRKGAVLTLCLGNLEAIKLGKRGSEPGLDLNREFTMNVGTPSDKKTRVPEIKAYEEDRAIELAPFLRETNVLVDIHATNRPSDPFVRISGICTDEHLRIASWFGALGETQDLPKAKEDALPPFTKTKLLLDSNFTLGGKICTTDEFVGGLGGVGICVETGLCNDLSREDEFYQRILEMLDVNIGLQTAESEPILRIASQLEELPFPINPYGESRIEIEDPLDTTEEKVAKEKRVVLMPPKYNEMFRPYNLTSVHHITERGFKWIEGYGEENWQRVAQGTQLGCYDKERTVEESIFYTRSKTTDASRAAEVQKAAGRGLLKEMYFTLKDSVILFPKQGELLEDYKPAFWLAEELELSHHSSSGEVYAFKWSAKAKRYLSVSVLNFITRANRRNFDIFLAFLHNGAPSTYRKPGTKQSKVITDRRHFLEHAPVAVDGVQVKIMSNLKSGKHNLLGFSITQSLASIRKAQKKARMKADADGVVSPRYDSYARQIIHKEDGDPRPVYVYPTSYRVGEEFFNRGWKPYFSPRLTLPKGILQGEKNGVAYLGVAIVREFTKDEFEEMHSLGDYVIPGYKEVFIATPLSGSAYYVTERAPVSPPIDCITVVGNEKAHVGKTYSKLCRVLQFLDKVRNPNSQLFEFHPVYTDRGEAISAYASKMLLTDSHLDPKPSTVLSSKLK